MSEWKKVKIGDIAVESKTLESNPDVNKKIRVRLNVKGVEQRPIIAEKEGATKYYVRRSGQFVYGRQNFHKGAFGVIPNSLDGFSSSADLPAFDIDKSCIPEWLVFWFKTENRYLQLSKHAKGIGSQRVSTSDFYKTEILLPNINTQRAIIKKVQTIEQNTVKFDSEISNQQTYLTQLRQAILQEAIEGKLTADWRVKNPVEKGNPDFDAAALLATIKAEKQKLIAEGKIKKEKPLAPINADDVPFALPDGWVWVRLGEICFVTKLAGFEFTKYFSLKSEGEIPVVRAQNVKPNRLIEENLLYIEKSVSEILHRSALTKPCLLITFIGAGIGEVAVFDKQERWHLAPNVAKAEVLNDEISLKYLMYVTHSSLGISEFFKFQKATAQPSLSMGTIRQILIPLPSLAEQNAIVERVDRLLASVNALEQQVQERKTYAEQLMQAVLKEAFAG